MAYKFLIVGSGFSGSVLANRLCAQLECTIDIWDERKHVGGNCYTERDSETGIMVHAYGPHIFHTDKKEVWDFVNSFVEFKPYAHKVKALSNGKVYSLPVNLTTINRIFNKNFTSEEAKAFLETVSDHNIEAPKNFEEQALKFIGSQLYHAFFYGYTKKQWGCDPAELPASVLKRIPVRFDYNDNYHDDVFTGIPVDGYTELFKKLTENSPINITLNKKYNIADDTSSYNHVFFTGPIDAYFHYKYGRLGYRTVTFETQTAPGNFQGTAQVNYCDAEVPYTRIIEHKYFAPWEKHEQTIYSKEFSKETAPSDIPYYPKRLDADKIILKRYFDEAKQLNGVSFLGRLATYRYMDMHHVISEAMGFSKEFIMCLQNNQLAPVFPSSIENSL
jgi:UDP-galactopyranose mutase